MLERVKRWWAREREQTDAEFQRRLDDLRRREPVPVFWLFGKTQSGKTTVVRYLTGATDAEIGSGFQPCTRFSRKYDFPNSEAQLLEFLDTRGVDEPGYDPTEDLRQFNDAAHVVIVTVKAVDHAQENVINHLKVIREARPERPVLLLLTCLHEAYPQQQHPPYPFRAYRGDEPIILPDAPAMLTDLMRSLELQRRRFEGLVDSVLPIDITRPEEGYDQPEYGGPALRATLTDLLPKAQRHTLEMVERNLADLKELHARKVLPTIYGFSLLAGTAGAIPIPFLSLLLLPRIQRKMVESLAEQFGRPLSAEQFVELAEKLGIGSLRRTAAGELLKFVPYVGVVAGATAHAASTYALGKAFSHYDALATDGASINIDELREYYQTQLKEATEMWRAEAEKRAEPAASGAGGSR
jgi:uncharacterized protein (DUF697 family)